MARGKTTTPPCTMLTAGLYRFSSVSTIKNNFSRSPHNNRRKNRAKGFHPGAVFFIFQPNSSKSEAGCLHRGQI